MNRGRTPGGWVPQLPWQRARSRRTIALAIIAIASFAGAFGTGLFAYVYAENRAQPLGLSPESHTALVVAEAHSFERTEPDTHRVDVGRRWPGSEHV